MDGTYKLMAMMIYGGGLRLSECLRLRIKDIDFEKGLIIIPIPIMHSPYKFLTKSIILSKRFHKNFPKEEEF